MKRMGRAFKSFVHGELFTAFCKKFKIVRMHERRSGKPHSLLFQADRLPKDYVVITREIESLYDLRRGDVVIDSIDIYKRSKDEPRHKPTRATIVKNSRFAPISKGSDESAGSERGYDDAIRQEWNRECCGAHRTDAVL